MSIVLGFLLQRKAHRRTCSTLFLIINYIFLFIFVVKLCSFFINTIKIFFVYLYKFILIYFQPNISTSVSLHIYPYFICYFTWTSVYSSDHLQMLMLSKFREFLTTIRRNKVKFGIVNKYNGIQGVNFYF